MSDAKSDERFIVDMLRQRRRDITDQIFKLSGDAQKLDRILADMEGGNPSPDEGEGETLQPVTPRESNGRNRSNRHVERVRTDRSAVLWRTIVNTTGPQNSWKPFTLDQLHKDSGYPDVEKEACRTMLNAMAKQGALIASKRPGSRVRYYTVPEKLRTVKHYATILEMFQDTRKVVTGNADG